MKQVQVDQRAQKAGTSSHKIQFIAFYMFTGTGHRQMNEMSWY